MATLTNRLTYPQILEVADWLADLTKEEFSFDSEPHRWFFGLSEILSRKTIPALA